MTLIIMKSSLPHIQKNLKGSKAELINSIVFEDRGDYLRETKLEKLKNQ